MIGLEDIAGIQSPEEGRAVGLALYNQLLYERDICSICFETAAECECDDEADYAVEKDDDDE
jgi:hypothetical protein